MNRTLFLTLGLLGTACASNLSTLQTAKTLHPGQWRIAGGTGLYLPAGQVVSATAEGVNLAVNGTKAVINNQPDVVTNDDRDKVITAAAALAVVPPGNPWEVSARVGLFENFDVGLRYSLNAVRLDAKFRFFHGGDAEDDLGRRSYDLAIGVGVTRQLFKNPLIDSMSYIHLTDFSRWDVEVPLYMSADFNPYFGLYFAPKYVYSRINLAGSVLATSSGPCGCREVVPLPSVINTHFVGATAGLRAGHPRIAAYVEITAGETMAHLNVLGKERDIGGATLYPSIGLVGTFR